MLSLELVITIALATTIIGVIIGFFIARRTAPSQKTQRQMESQLAEMKQQQQDYQHEVSEHFTGTAHLLSQLANSYRDVHNHLAKGAQVLAGETASQSITLIADDSENDEDQQATTDNISPPLDYAPKTPNQPGTLNEKFGLDNAKKQDEEPATS